ncbi:hypothetical protein FHL06_10285 [Lactobacillus halodurans]|uniref:GH84 domain-containing protein n=2 Tax=Companilactobacillus halodurans TaxID=2584183 RepID=A0A5P0ZR75_9LACO|nr:hypothetical protein [Companilactobacillus halodurans]
MYMKTFYKIIYFICNLKEGDFKMSTRKFQHRKFVSNHKLLLLGVTTFGSLLVFSNMSANTNIVHASVITNEVAENNNSLNKNDASQTGQAENEPQKYETNSSMNENQQGDSREVNSNQRVNTGTNSNLNVQTEKKQVTTPEAQQNQNTNQIPVTSTPINNDGKVNKNQTNNVNGNNKVADAKVNKTEASINKTYSVQSNNVNTTVGASVKDNQTQQSIAETTQSLNDNQIDVDNTYFGLANDEAVNQQLSNLNTENAANLNDNGYLIRSGIVNNKKILVVQGKDATGLFYAINNLNNLISSKSSFDNINIRESPQMSIRGVIEGFYGQPWSHQAREDLFKFMGEHKMNVYIYSPKDDDYLRNNWKELYPQDKLNQIKELVESAKRNHVSFVYTLSPGNDITYSSQADFDKTVAKLDQLRSIGVQQFYIALDDIPLGMTEEDSKVFKNHPTTNYPNNPWSALADAQAYYVNRVQKEYVKKHNLPDLWLVPTNYNGSKQDPFKEAQGEALDKDIRLQWTGEGVFSGEITNESVEEAKKTYHSDHLFIWDNFPVNDSDQDRLYLNPLEGRSKDLYKIMDGFTSNPMIQPYASWFGLAGFGEYMWNANTYSPSVTLQNTLHEIAGDNPEALVALQSFVDLNQYWDYATDKNKVHAPILSIFVNSYENATYGTPEYTEAKQALIERLNIIADSPETMTNLKTVGFYDDSLPWINASSHWAKALLEGININDYINSNQNDNAVLSGYFKEFTKQISLANAKALPDSRTGKPDLLITPYVGDGIFQNFTDKVYTSLDAFLGGTAIKTETNKIASQATTEIPQNGDYSPENMSDGNLNTKYWSNRSVKAGDTIEISLDQAQDIQRLDLYQGTDDAATSGDMFKTAVIYAGNKKDGSDKRAIGLINSVGHYQLNINQPINVKYLFITATSKTDNWLQIREIAVNGKTGLNISNIQSIGQIGSQAIFDGTNKTAYVGKLNKANETGTIEQLFTKISGIHSVKLVGQVNGKVYVHQNNEWKYIGNVSNKQAITDLKVDDSAVDGIKVVVDRSDDEFVINEINFK